MRLRACVLACALAMLGSLSAAGLASAAPRHSRNLTIAATPNPVNAGDPVLVYGRLLGPDNGGQTIRLYHHVSGSGHGYTPILTTTTDSSGYYSFIRSRGVVDTNRSWFVRGPNGSHSRTVYEKVIPEVSISASTTTTDTNHAIVFSGHVIPNHRFEQVFLQQQIGSGDDWRTLRSSTLDPSSDYWIAYRWRRPGLHDVRVLFRAEDRNLSGASQALTVTIAQAQVAGFTINSSAPVINSGGSVTISGILDQAGTHNPSAGAPVQLWGRTPDRRFVVRGNTMTASDGSYSFTQSGLTTNVIYYVATVASPHRHSAMLHQGVRDVVTLGSSTSSAPTGQRVTFTGTVLPDKADHLVYLQKLGADGDWHTVKTGIVRHNSTFGFSWTLGAPGSYTFRARIAGDENNVGSTSPPVSVTATTPAPASLPTAP